MPSRSHLATIRHLLKSISSKRARIVIEHIPKHGQITTEDLERLGYNHPPRAARDVREAGIPLETFRVPSSSGRSIAAYRFGDLDQIRIERLQGRRDFPKTLKEELYKLSGGRCAICYGRFEARYLQVDHKVPYEVAGDKPDAKWNPKDFMVLCGPCNRAKSWSCEHCDNWLVGKRPRICQTCYWANPENYVHIALREVRRADILWNEDEVEAYERLKQSARRNQTPIPEYVKIIIGKHLPE